MSKLLSKDLNKKGLSELEKLLSSKRKELQEFRFGIAGSKVKNIKEGRNIKRDIARIMTAIKTQGENK